MCEMYAGRLKVPELCLNHPLSDAESQRLFRHADVGSSSLRCRPTFEEFSRLRENINNTAVNRKRFAVDVSPSRKQSRVEQCQSDRPSRTRICVSRSCSCSFSFITKSSASFPECKYPKESCCRTSEGPDYLFDRLIGGLLGVCRVTARSGSIMRSAMDAINDSGIKRMRNASRPGLGGKFFLAASQFRIFFQVLLFVGLMRPCCFVPTSPPTVISDFSPGEILTFQDQAPQTDNWFHYMNTDPNNEAVLYLGAVDYVYRLNAANITNTNTGYLKSGNISQTTLANFNNMYGGFVSNCRTGPSPPPKPDYQCRNHIRVIQPQIDGRLYVCSTAAYNPQEFYLDSSLTVTTVNGGGSGLFKCPFDPDTRSDITLYTVQGNPNNQTAFYAATLVNQDSRYAIYRSAIPSAGVGVAAVPPLATSDGKNSPKNDVSYVARFDIGPYVYFFFREVATEFSNYDRVVVSRVGRICKSDQGGIPSFTDSNFMSYVKTRINCSIGGGANNMTHYFNELSDVWYDSSSGFFYGLFLANGLNWGSAVCIFALSNITTQFDTGKYYIQNTGTSSWVLEQDSNVPSPRPSTCNYTTNTPLSVQTFVVGGHFLMYGSVNQVTSLPPYISRDQAFTRMLIDFVNNYPVLYLYSPLATDQITRVVLWSVNSSPVNAWTQGGVGSSNVILVLRPFKGDFSPMWQMLFHTVQSKKSLYIVKESTVTQLSLSLCSHYILCTSCIQDPYCDWDGSSMTCKTSQTRSLPNVMAPSPLSVCSASCKVPGLSTPPVIPLTSVMLNCTSRCAPEGTVSWTFFSGSLPASSNYTILQNGSLIIMNVTRPNVGAYQCMSNNVVLAEQTVILSSCVYGEDIRDTFIREYMGWCGAFDKYKADYQQWLCMKNYCVQAGSKCIPNIESCPKGST